MEQNSCHECPTGSKEDPGGKGKEPKVALRGLLLQGGECSPMEIMRLRCAAVEESNLKREVEEARSLLASQEVSKHSMDQQETRARDWSRHNHHDHDHHDSNHDEDDKNDDMKTHDN